MRPILFYFPNQFTYGNFFKNKLTTTFGGKSLSDPSCISKSTQVNLADVKHLAQRFKQVLGKTREEFSAKKGNPFGTKYRIARRSGAAGGSSSLPWEIVDKERVSPSLEKYIQNLTLPGAMPRLYDELGQEQAVRPPPVARNGGAP